jgi:hypothetical protein
VVFFGFAEFPAFKENRCAVKRDEARIASAFLGSEVKLIGRFGIAHPEPFIRPTNKFFGGIVWQRLRCGEKDDA